MKKIIIGLVIGVVVLGIILAVTLILINIKKPTMEFTTMYEYPIPNSNETVKVISTTYKQRNFFSSNEEFKANIVAVNGQKKQRLLE